MILMIAASDVIPCTCTDTAQMRMETIDRYA